MKKSIQVKFKKRLRHQVTGNSLMSAILIMIVSLLFIQFYVQCLKLIMEGNQFLIQYFSTIAACSIWN